MKAWFFRPAALAAIALLLSGCVTDYYPYQGGSPMIGQGGAAKTINGVDIWQIGTPPRKFQIIGFIEDSRPGGPPSMAQRDGALAAVAKAHGGDGVLIQSDAVQYLGTFTTGNATTTLTNTSAFTTGTTISAPGAGLAAVHKQKLVHRDIKPSNIMVNLEEGGVVTAKIIDLGLAKAVNEAGTQTEISIPGGFVGTPEFASPEQFAGLGADIRSDLYSLGVTLWEMVTGKTPFRGSSAEVMFQHQHAPLPLERLRDVPQPVVVLLEKLLEKDPAQRFQSPDELLKAMLTIRGAIEARCGTT